MQDDTSLFDSTAATHEPLAARMRPRNLDEYIGQAHIVGRGRLLRRAIAADQLSSVIFYGPPGSGKTTLARVIAGHTKSSFISLNAVLTGVADIRKAIADAEQQRKLYNKKTILFVDEVHRWNRSQQDALLPWVENGTIILIGATTENPFFEVNKALVSRSRVFQLKALTDDDLLAVARQALADTERGYGHWKVSFEDGALEHLVQTASGDARSLLNALELAVETTPDSWNPQATPPQPSWGSSIYISRETAEESIQKKVVLYDKDGDYHYDIISAFIKSLRGRDPDAACYWLARMVRAGEDPDFIFRRMLISACEDTGLADPQAVTVVSSCAAAFDRVGMPEGRYFLAHAALYLATAPKSNSSMAFFDALAAVEKEDADVPNHLRDANRDAEGFGHGAGYLYPHAYRDHWVAQQYLPDSLVGRVFYTPTTQGYEAHIREDVLSRRELQISSLLEKKTGLESGENVWWGESGNPHPFVVGEENLTFSPEDRKKESALERADRAWRNRLETNRAETLLSLRNAMLASAALLRHHRSLVWAADDALLLFELLRKSPEGCVCGVCRNQDGRALLEQYARSLGTLDRPQLTTMIAGEKAFAPRPFMQTLRTFTDVCFDRAFFRDIIGSADDIDAWAASLLAAFRGLEKDGRDFASADDGEALHKDMPPVFDRDAVAVISQRIPCHTQRLAALIADNLQDELQALDAAQHADLAAALRVMQKAEDAFFTDPANPLFSWDAGTVTERFQAQGLAVTASVMPLTEKRSISEQQLARWFGENSLYAGKLREAVGSDALAALIGLLKTGAQKKSFVWHSENVFFTCRLPQTDIK